MFFLMLLVFFLWEAQKEEKKRSMVTKDKPCKSQFYSLWYSNQEIKFFDAGDLDWVEKETPWRQPWAIDQRKKTFRFFNQKNLMAFLEACKKDAIKPGPVIYN